ncbi:MAG: O-antigen ligase family protein, partial [Akkermansiaceae bacterium]|nr:O-antigen ligase family protein [Verrucomicrobiales bacterium]
IITTNGMEVANPVILKKYEKGRAFGTLVYPNALAGAILLLFPVSIVLAWNSTRRFRAPTRLAAIGLTAFLGLGALFWTGSKSGWLIAIIMGGVWLFRLDWSTRMKWLTLGLILVVGLGLFGIRFQNYFAAGATSVGARLDYWRAAIQTTIRNPILGTGPGTFQRPYERIKSPEAEMARLTHNDYLEQFSDSGVVGGLTYMSWVTLLLITLARRLWKRGQLIHFAVFLGCLGWFIQGFSEFGLYVPALAWTAFLLGGCLLGLTGNQIDKPNTAR